MAEEVVQPSLALTLDEGGEGEAAGAVETGLSAHIAALYGPADPFAFTLALRKGGAVLGGLRAVGHWRWLYIRQLWVQDAARGQGLGTRLIEAALAEARRRDCVGAYIDTFDPEAAAYYGRRGFREFGRIPGFPPGHCRTFLMRSL